MSHRNRTNAIDAIANYPPLPVFPPNASAMDHYGEYVFGQAAIRRYLPHVTADKLLATMSGKVPFDPSIAEDVARAMKEWAVSLGATHYTHWFQPLHGGTAEKHDSFLERTSEGEAIASFSGKNLIVGEPDASSLPSGGLRSTFEARGYTAWDPTSPAFIKRHSNGATLYIPTVFFSYTGAVLDKKTPLLRSIQAIQRSITRLMDLFKLPSAPVTITLGAEQEYFLIDQHFYLNRPDLIQTGRTLFGTPPAKHQQLDDHYFGSIRPRILAFMTDVDQELWKLGIPAKTRHNETAPAQFEIAAIFEELNLCVDHNLLIMEVLRQVAHRHHLVCLLHEKPFAGINGSGKHNNWSVAYGDRNLLDPGDDPYQNAIFLTFLTAILRAVDLHADLLRSSVATAGNEHRLGSHEAPPAIISVFLGDQLMEVIERLETGEATPNHASEPLRIGVDTLPPLSRDATDRNRTSPFAFTGNKFEFRACGSAQSCAGPNTAMNTIVAESVDFIADELEKLAPTSPEDFADGLQSILRSIIKDHKRIIFNGNNYSEEWVEEAKRRGLPNLVTTEEGLSPLVDKKNQDLYERYHVLSGMELDTRHEYFLKEYRRKVRIEAEVMLEIATNSVLPLLVNEYGQILDVGLKTEAMEIKAGGKTLKSFIIQVGERIDALQEATRRLRQILAGDDDGGIQEAMNEVRRLVDGIESYIDDSRWPFPKYREMLFII